jgi:GAF domain-containing protein
MESASASATALLRDDANLARQQLTALQSVTDPALNVLSGVELVGALLDRLRTAVDADGVAIYHHNGLRSRVFSSTDGVAPASSAMRRPATAGYQSGRTTLIHNDCERVAETSVCQWPPEMASLIVVPVVYSGRLQLVVEVASRRARRSTEWELALIQVVAERAAGLLRPDTNFDTGAVA